jgi:signal transduction histidine kinase
VAVVKRIVEGVRGKITYVSEEGKGTAFVVELPKNNVA